MCTGLLVILIPVSIWVRPEAMLMYNSKVHSNRGVIVRLSGSHCTLLYSSGRVVHSYDPVPIVGFDLDYWYRWPVKEELGAGRWLSPVWWIGGQVIRGVEISLIYPAVFGMIWSGLIWRRRPRFPAGHCMKCGYSLDGLTNDVCPECGEWFDGEANA